MKLIIYGAGNRCIELCEKIKDSKYEIVSIVDSNPSKWGKQIEGHFIKEPKEIQFPKNVKLCITVADYSLKIEIREFLRREYGAGSFQEIEYETIIYNICEENSAVKDILKRYKKREVEHNVIFDCYNIGLGLGGIEAWTKDVCNELLKNGRENIYVVSKPGEYKISERLQPHIIFVDYWSEESYSMPAIEELVSIIVGKLPCKIITCQTGNLMIAAKLVKNCFPNDLEVISVIHGGNDEIYTEYIKKSDVTDIYLGVSQDICREMIARGIDKSRVFSISCPFSCDREVVRSYSLNPLEPIRIGYAGRLEIVQKRMDLLLKLISVLKEKEVNFFLEIAGDGSAIKDMKQYIDIHHLNDRVSFLGKLERSQISSFWRRQDICINIADYEGRSISIIEAMGNGAVPVVTMVSGTREDITDGENGYLVPLQDYATMSERIQYLTNNRELLPNLGKTAHDVVYPKSLMSEHMRFLEKILYM